MRRASLPNAALFAWSFAPFCRLICDHLLCPDMFAIVYTGPGARKTNHVRPVYHGGMSAQTINLTIAVSVLVLVLNVIGWGFSRLFPSSPTGFASPNDTVFVTEFQ